MRSEEEKKSIHELELGESLSFRMNGIFMVVLRVPGGWNYISQPERVAGISSVFVPCNNELELAE